VFHRNRMQIPAPAKGRSETSMLRHYETYRNRRRQTVGINCSKSPLLCIGRQCLLATKKASAQTWEQLQESRILRDPRAAWYNTVVAEKYGAEIVAFPRTYRVPRPRWLQGQLQSGWM